MGEITKLIVWVCTNIKEEGASSRSISEMLQMQVYLWDYMLPAPSTLGPCVIRIMSLRDKKE